MVNNVLLAKIGGGMIAAGGVGGAGYAYKDEIHNFLFGVKKLKAPENSYLVGEFNKYTAVVPAKVTETETNVDATKKLQVGKDKNYFCQIKDEKVKIDCEITKIDIDATKKSKKLSELKNLTSLSTETTSDLTISADSYYKLKLNDEDLIKFNDSLEKTIDLVEKKGETIYGTFTSKFLIINGVAKQQNNLLVTVSAAIETTGTTDEATTNYKCFLSSDDATGVACKVYKLTTPKDENTKAEDIDFSTNTLTAVDNTSSMISDNKLSIVVFNDKIDFSKIEKNLSITYKPTGDTNNKKTYVLTVKEKLIGDITTITTKGIFIQDSI